MIFDENYDRALWLILAGDSNNRKKIANCIKKIPNEIYVEICLLIKQSYDFPGEPVYKCFLNDIYCLNVKIENNVLMISYSNNVNGEELCEDYFDISLFGITQDQLFSRNVSSDKMMVGEFQHVIKKLQRCECCGNGYVYKNGLVKEEYSLLPKSLVVERVCRGIQFFSPIWNTKVKLYKMPEKMYIHQLDNEKRISRLVREK